MHSVALGSPPWFNRIKKKEKFSFSNTILSPLKEVAGLTSSSSQFQKILKKMFTNFLLGASNKINVENET